MATALCVGPMATRSCVGYNSTSSSYSFDVMLQQGGNSYEEHLCQSIQGLHCFQTEQPMHNNISHHANDTADIDLTPLSMLEDGDDLPDVSWLTACAAAIYKLFETEKWSLDNPKCIALRDNFTSLGMSSGTSRASIVCAVVYLGRIERHFQTTGVSVSGCGQQLAMVALLLARKANNDVPPSNTQWAQLCKVQMRILNQLELMFLQCTQYSMHVSETEYNRTFQWLEKIATVQQGISALKTLSAPATYAYPPGSVFVQLPVTSIFHGHIPVPPNNINVVQRASASAASVGNTPTYQNTPFFIPTQSFSGNPTPAVTKTEPQISGKNVIRRRRRNSQSWSSISGPFPINNPVAFKQPSPYVAATKNEALMPKFSAKLSLKRSSSVPSRHIQ